MKQTTHIDGHSLELEPKPVESVSSASYYLKGGAVILGTGALYVVAKTTGALSWLWSGIEAYTSGATVSEDKSVQTVSSAIQVSHEADSLLSPLKPSAGTTSSGRVEELDSLDLVELDQKSNDKAAPLTTEEIHAPGRRLLQTNTLAEMTWSYFELSSTCQLTAVSDGQIGFSLQGQAGDESGYSVSSAGDINGDGLDDILVGSPYASNYAGKTTVVFGSNQSGAWGAGTLNLTVLADGQRGFALLGSSGYSVLGRAGDSSGYSVSSAGDINGDGLDDILVGAPGASNGAGKTTVVFGSNQSGVWGNGTLNLTALADGKRGFVLLGQAGDSSGYSVSSAGDINGDGLDDILVGAPNAGGSGSLPFIYYAGQTTLVFGSNQSGAWGNGTLNLAELADGRRGFVLQGQGKDQSGTSVSSAGDINGDQLDDILIGAPYALYSSTFNYAGKTTVVFGSNQSNAWGTGTLNLTVFADGHRGFVLQGQTSDQSGTSVSCAGDINGDGLADILVESPQAFSGRIFGVTTVVFGSNQSGAWGAGTLNLTTLANGQRGFVLLGDVGSVSSAGDINGDGLDDILIGSANTTVVFGSNQSGAWGAGTLNLAALANGQHGFVLQGQASDKSGWSVSSAGDINGDRLADILVGAPGSTTTTTSVGKTTLVFGPRIPQVIVNQLSIAAGETVRLDASMLSVISATQNNATIVLTPEAVEYGEFEAVSTPGIALQSFLSGNITSVQFRHFGSSVAPSYRIAVRTPLFYAYSVAQITFLGFPPALINNALYVNQGLATVLTPNDLSASDQDYAVGSLLFIFSNVQHAQFNQLDINGNIVAANISSCLQQLIFNRQIELMPDGSVIAPSYDVVVSNSQSITTPLAAVITFNQAPVLTMHPLTLDQGQATTISPDAISATDDQTPSDNLLFLVGNVTHGYFVYRSNSVPLTQFTQFPLSISNVEFVQDGSDSAPTFSLQVNDGQISSAWQMAQITFNHRPMPQRTLPDQTVVEGQYFSFDLGDGLFTDPDGHPLTLQAQLQGGDPLPTGMTFNANRTELGGVLQSLLTLQIQIVASDPRGLTASTDFTLQSVAPKSGFDFRSLYNTLSVFGGIGITILGYIWWRRKAASHRTGYEFANTLRKVLNLEYYDFTKDKGELYKTHIERFLVDLKSHHNFYIGLNSIEERQSFAVCVGEIIRGKSLLKKSDCPSAAYNRFFLFSPSWPSGLKLDEFGRLSSQIAQEAVTVWNAESQKEDGDPLARWAYRSSSARESKATPSSEMEVVEIKEQATGKLSASSARHSDSLFPATTRKSSREVVPEQAGDTPSA